MSVFNIERLLEDGQRVAESGERWAASAPGILVVDDDPKNLLAMEVALEGLDAELVAVESGAQALRHLLVREFAVVILDVRMPTMDGFEAARLIRSRPRTRHVPIIFVTASSPDLDDVRVGYEMGAVDYLFRPIVPEILRAKVQVFIDLQEQRDQIVEQARLLREMHEREAERRLEEKRQEWEALALRRRMEQQDEVNRQLELADRRKDEFIAMLAHELRNPLMTLSVGVGLLSEHALEPRATRVRDAMGRQVRHLARLVDDLLDVSRISHGKLEIRRGPIAFCEIVDAALEECRAAVEADGRQLVIEAPPRPLEIDADEVRLTQVLCNLLGNAARYTDPGGRIELAWQAEADELVVTVADDGRGIAPEFLDRIFDKFAQECDDGRGLGLGLTLSRQLVAMHGGSLVARSDGRGHGTTFEIRLPGVRVQAPRAAGAPAPSLDETSHAALRVVVVDDDDDVRELVHATLESWGHLVVSTASGTEGVDRIAELRPDVALVDIGLTDIDGYDVAARVRERCGGAPPRLVAITGFGHDAARSRSREVGFDAHLVKPVNPQQLRRVLGTHSSRRSRAKES